MISLQDKEEALRRQIRRCGSLAVAFSGGLDSTLLAAVAAEELDGRALAITAVSPLYPEQERREAASLAALLGLRQIETASDELGVEGFADNPPDRCYLCKRALFETLWVIARGQGIAHLADGSNRDDLDDYRPGRRAAQELGVLSPLLEAGLGKEEIRALSRRLKLPTAEKAAFACLASRFPHHTRITEEALRAIGAVETGLREKGFGQFRARYHGDTVRIELPGEDLARACGEPLRRDIAALGHRAGFRYVALDLDGYRTGSMNPEG